MTQQITLQRGEYRLDRVTVTRAGVAVNLTGATIRLVVIRGNYPAGSVVDDSAAFLVKTVGAGILLSDPTNGIFDIEWAKADTNSLEFLQSQTQLAFVFGIEYLLATDTYARPMVNGVLIVTPDIVRTI